MSVAPAQYRLRYVDAVLDEALPALPAFLMTGPRGVGKTTTMARRAASIVRLDRPDEAAIFRDSPDAALDRLPRPRLHHVRAADGRHEVDQLIDLGDRGVIAIEIKSTSSPGPSDAKHHAWLREQLGSRFAAGIVCHTGPRPFPMGERIRALPIASFWQG